MTRRLSIVALVASLLLGTAEASTAPVINRCLAEAEAAGWRVHTRITGPYRAPQLRSYVERDGVRVRLERNLPHPFRYVFELQAHLPGAGPQPRRVDLTLANADGELMRVSLAETVLRRAWRSRAFLARAEREVEVEELNALLAAASGPVIIEAEAVSGSGPHSLTRSEGNLSGLDEALETQRQQVAEMLQRHRGIGCAHVD
ncbi:MAG: hypothetical protein KIS81_03835 [Maricaulaceae bacterium]|nr:hypothetical protein [Maricaulaceae bacterium]